MIEIGSLPVRIRSGGGTLPAFPTTMNQMFEEEPQDQAWQVRHDQNSMLTCVRQVTAPRETANLGRKALEVEKQTLGPRPRKGASGLALSLRPLAGVSRVALGFGAPVFVAQEVNDVQVYFHDSRVTLAKPKGHRCSSWHRLGVACFLRGACVEQHHSPIIALCSPCSMEKSYVYTI